MSNDNTTEAPRTPTVSPLMNREDLAAAFLPAYKEACERLKARHGSSYVHYLTGEVPGLEGPYEERALSWLGIEVRQEEHAARTEATLRSGLVDAERLTAEERAQRHPLVILVGRGKEHRSRKYGVADDSHTEWIEIPDGLILFEGGKPECVVPKAKRLYGNEVGSLRVLVKKAPRVEQETLAVLPAAN